MAAPGTPPQPGQARKHATVRDVAARAGVSVATVSRALSGDYPMTATTRNRVMRAVRELDYVPNAHARALSAARAGAIAIVVNTVAQPFYAYIAQGVEEQASQEGRLSLVCTTGGDPDRELSIVAMLREQRAEAVILVGSVIVNDAYRSRMTGYARSLEAAGSRLVLCGRPPLGDDVPALVVGYDNTGGAYAITSHLLSAGHRRILYLGVRPGHTTSDGRVAGYRKALADHGIALDSALEAPCGFSRSEAYAVMRRRLGAGDPGFTAIFACNDLVAAGAVQALREHGLRVPGDVSIVGYDDVSPAPDIGLTTVHLPHDELGRTAVRLALSARDPAAESPVTLGTHIVVRESVRPLTGKVT